MHLEFALIPLRRQQAELSKRLAALERRGPGDAELVALTVQLRQQEQEVRDQIRDHLGLLEDGDDPAGPAGEANTGTGRGNRVEHVAPSPGAVNGIATTNRIVDEVLRAVNARADLPVASSPEVALLERESQVLGAELSTVRYEVLGGLRALADGLHRYEQLAQHKTDLSKRLAAATGKDQSYANYIDCALLRQHEYEDDLRYVVETLKKTRVVA